MQQFNTSFTLYSLFTIRLSVDILKVFGNMSDRHCERGRCVRMRGRSAAQSRCDAAQVEHGIVYFVHRYLDDSPLQYWEYRPTYTIIFRFRYFSQVIYEILDSIR